MAQKTFEADYKLRMELTALYLGQHHRFDLLKKHHKAAMSKMEEQSAKGMKHFRAINKLLEEQYFHPEYEKLPRNEMLLPDMMEALDREYALKKLFIACEYMNVSHFYEQTTTIPLLARVQQLVGSFSEQEHPVFKIFLNTSFLLQAKGGKELFTETKQLAIEHFDKMEYMERTASISLLINHAAREYRQTDDQFFINQIHELQLFGLEKKMFIYLGKMNESTFSNICNTAVLAGKTSFAEYFIKCFQKYLKEDIREEMVALANAFMYLYDNKAEIAYEHIGQAKFISLRYRLVARPIILQCLYEMQKCDPTYEQLLDSKLIAFKKFINENNGIKNERKTRYLNFVYVLKKIKNFSGNQNELDILENELRAGLPIISKKWLLDKISNISQKRKASNGRLQSGQIN